MIAIQNVTNKDAMDVDQLNVLPANDTVSISKLESFSFFLLCKLKHQIALQNCTIYSSAYSTFQHMCEPLSAA